MLASLPSSPCRAVIMAPACDAFCVVASCAVAACVTTLTVTSARSGVADTVASPTATMDAVPEGACANDTVASARSERTFRVVSIARHRASRRYPLAASARTRSSARRWRWQGAAFGERFHVLQRSRELRGLLRDILFARGIVGQHRVVEHQRVHE